MRSRLWCVLVPTFCLLFSPLVHAAGSMAPSLGEVPQQLYPEQVAAMLIDDPSFSTNCHGLPAHNFGVLVANDYYHIYRSRGLGEKGVYEVFDHLQRAGLPRPHQVIYMNKQGFHKSFVGAILPFLKTRFKGLDDFAYQEARLFGGHGPFADVIFRHPLLDPVYLAGHNPVTTLNSYEASSYTDKKSRELFGKNYGGRRVRTHIVASKDNLYHVLDFILGQRETLFHCTGGIHRTGMVGLAIRYLQGGRWTEPFKAPVVILGRRGSTYREATIHNLAEAEYVLHNRKQIRVENFEAMRMYAAQERFQALVSKYRDLLNLPSTCAQGGSQGA